MSLLDRTAALYGSPDGVVYIVNVIEWAGVGAYVELMPPQPHGPFKIPVTQALARALKIGDRVTLSIATTDRQFGVPS